MSSRSITALILAIALLASCFAGCVPSKPEPSNTEAPVETLSPTEAILARLAKGKLIKKTSAEPSANVLRKEFAYDVIFWSGFAAQEKYYICANDYQDIGAFSDDMVHAEIAVNQGYMLRPAAGKFNPNEPVTYGEVLRGTL